MTIWFETDDLFVHFDWNPNPTGIQRVAQAIMVAARAESAGTVAFCRMSRGTGRLQAVDGDAVMALGPGPARERAAPPWLEPSVRAARRVFRFASRRALRQLRDYAGGRAAEREFAARVGANDVVVCLGLPWKNLGYGGRVAAAKRLHGFVFAALIHDVLPLTDPAFFPPSFVTAFSRWFDETVPACDVIFAGSAYVEEAVRSVCGKRGLPTPKIERLRFGAPFPLSAPGGDVNLPARFVLYVSSVVPRKNHALLVRVWRRLAERHGAAAVPNLVMAGSGAGSGALRAAIETTGLQGKILVVPDLGDAELREAYRRCLFTVYPSFAEGWGLPIAESLAFGKFCVASDRASLPEAGGDLIEYFDPSDEDGALAKIERAVFDADYLAARTARIVAEYRVPGWDSCAAAMTHALAGLARASLGTAA